MYLGQEPTVGSYDLVTVSEAFNGSRTAFTMSKSVASANQLMIILSGVTQHWGEAFTVSGTTLTFTSAPPTGSTIRILDFGRHVLDVGTPTDGTITTAKLADDAVTIAKLAATGTASGSTFLRGDNTWGAISSTSITDADNNTKVQVEESADENIIRFDTAGTERMIVNASGNVGIGTSAPESDSILELESGSPGPRLRLTNTTASGDSWKIHANNDGTLNFLDDTNSTVLGLTTGGSATGQFVARAWCRYNGTGTAAIDDSHNASSLNDYGTGDQKIIWSITMATTNYCAIGLCGNGSNVSRNMSTKTYATTSTRFMYGEDNGTNQDMSQCNAVIFGD